MSDLFLVVIHTRLYNSHGFCFFESGVDIACIYIYIVYIYILHTLAYKMIMNLYYKYTHIWHMDEQNIIDSFVWLSCLTNVSENNQWQKIGNIGVGLWLGKIHRRLLRMTGRLYGFDPIAAIAFVHYVCHLGFPIWLHWNPIKYIYI